MVRTADPTGLGTEPSARKPWSADDSGGSGISRRTVPFDVGTPTQSKPDVVVPVPRIVPVVVVGARVVIGVVPGPAAQRPAARYRVPHRPSRRVNCTRKIAKKCNGAARRFNAQGTTGSVIRESAIRASRRGAPTQPKPDVVIPGPRIVSVALVDVCVVPGEAPGPTAQRPAGLCFSRLGFLNFVRV